MRVRNSLSDGFGRLQQLRLRLHSAGPSHDHEVAATDLDVANPDYTSTTPVGFGGEIEAGELSIPLRIHLRGHSGKPGKRDL